MGGSNATPWTPAAVRPHNSKEIILTLLGLHLVLVRKLKKTYIHTQTNDNMVFFSK